MNKPCLLLFAVALVVLAGLLLVQARGARLPADSACVPAGRLPRTHPGYDGVTIPPNLAPLNFVVDEPGRQVGVRVSGETGGLLEVAAPAGKVVIPPGPWRVLLAANRGREVRLEVVVREAGGRWQRFEPLRCRVAREAIDGTLVYRRLRPVFNYWSDLGIYQRDLSGFRETAILQNRALGGKCLNCHTFLSNRPDTFFFQVRPTDRQATGPVTVFARDGKVEGVDTRTSLNARAATYSAWHPSGRLVAFSFNRIRQFFHTAGDEPRDVVDLDAGLALYWVEGRQVSSAPPLTDARQLQTFPTWSPDGKCLYYCAAPKPWSDPKAMPYAQVPRVRCSLMRIPFDLAAKRWGTPETVLSSAVTKRSCLEPRLSPDGRFLLFTMCDYGAFPIHQVHSDLFLMDLSRPGFPYRRLEESPVSLRDSWHCWSSNGRWVVFSRKGDLGVLARPHFCYIDAEGRPSKPFVLPQQDPAFYDGCIESFNVPELVKGPVRVDWHELARAGNLVKPLKATAAP